MVERCEYLIVGGGLAGCTLGFLLGNAGADVLIAELRDAETKDKLCGELMEGSTMELFSRIFGTDGREALSPARLSVYRRRFMGREVVFHDVGCWSMKRKTLDDFALRRALSSGARLMDRCALRAVDGNAGTAAFENLRTKEYFDVRFSRLIGADGAYSAVRGMAAGEKPDVCTVVEGNAPLVSRDLVFEMIAGVETGYSWYIPYTEDAVLGCGFRSPDGASDAKAAREILASFCGRLGVDMPKNLRGAPITTGESVRLCAGAHSYFVGEAAGLIRKTDGAGIHYALLSAQRLAEFFLGGDDYEEAMKPVVEEVGRLARDAHKTQFLSNMAILRKGHPEEPLTNERRISSWQTSM